MHKRVAFICKGSAKQEGSNDLQHIDNNAEQIAILLEEYGRWRTECIELNNPQDIKEKFEKIEDDGTTDILFYYTGHGKYSNNSFYLVGEKDKEINFLETINSRKFTKNAVSIIIDACHSGKIIINEPNYEVFTATYGNFAFEYTKDNEPKLSYFTDFFVKNIKILASTCDEDICLSHVKEETKNYDFKDAQKPTLLETTKNTYTKINVIAYPKKEEQLIKEVSIEIKRQKNLQEFNELILSFIPASAILSDKQDSYEELVRYLIGLKKDKDIPFLCILKELQQSEIVVTAQDVLKKKHNITDEIICKKITQTFDKLIIVLSVVEAEEDSYKLQLFGQSETKEKSYSTNKTITTDQLAQEIDKTLNLSEFASCKHLEFILPRKLLHFDLKTLEGDDGKYFQEYDISIKIRERVDRLRPKQIERWKNNWKLFIASENSQVSQKSLLFQTSTPIATINKDITEKFPLIKSEQTISNDFFTKILLHGISMIIYPIYEKNSCICNDFDDVELKNLINATGRYIRDNCIVADSDKSHIALIWDNPHTTPKSLKERDTL